MIHQGNWEIRLNGCRPQLLQDLTQGRIKPKPTKTVGVNRFRLSTKRGTFVINVGKEEVTAYMRCCSMSDAHETGREIAAILSHAGGFSTTLL
jgi:hypothetical protein